MRRQSLCDKIIFEVKYFTNVHKACLSKCLNNGSYRLMVRIMDLRGPGDYDTYTLGVEFVIGR